MAEVVTNSDVPVAPLAPTSFKGWTNAFRLINGKLEVVIAPQIGRIAFLGRPGGENLLRLDERLSGRIPGQKDDPAWMNFGGDWFWPVPQAYWTALAGKDWPPPPALAERPWSGAAWKGADGSEYCLISREYGAPLFIKASRLIKLDAEKPIVTVRQRVEATRGTRVPICLWNITQVVQADRVLLSRSADSNFKDGYKVLNFAAPGTNALTLCEGGVALDPAAGAEHKLGSDADPAWVAAQKGAALILEKVENRTSEAPFPDGGCKVEFYSNSGLGYVEIETLSPEKKLARGDLLENLLTIEIDELSNAQMPVCSVVPVILNRAGMAPSPLTPD